MTLFAGITTRTVATQRLSVGILEREGDDARTPDEHVVVFVHGNVSSSLFWQQAMLDLPPEARAIAIDPSDGSPRKNLEEARRLRGGAPGSARRSPGRPARS